VGRAQVRGRGKSARSHAGRHGATGNNCATNSERSARLEEHYDSDALADLERARQLSAKKGLAYQTFIKMLLQEALDKEENRPDA
jgi:hypothetical protein